MQYMSKIPCVDPLSLLSHQPCISVDCHSKCWVQSSCFGWEVPCWDRWASGISVVLHSDWNCVTPRRGSDQSSLTALYSELHYMETYGTLSVAPLCFILFSVTVIQDRIHTWLFHFIAHLSWLFLNKLFSCGSCWKMGISPPGINYLSITSKWEIARDNPVWLKHNFLWKSVCSQVHTKPRTQHTILFRCWYQLHSYKTVLVELCALLDKQRTLEEFAAKHGTGWTWKINDSPHWNVAAEATVN